MRHVPASAFWLSLLAPCAAAIGQPIPCPALLGVTAHAGGGFVPLRGQQTRERSYQVTQALPGAERCWISQEKDGPSSYWCSWQPKNPADFDTEVRDYAEASAKCIPGASVSHRSGKTEVYAFIHVRDSGLRLYWTGDKTEKTIDLSIDWK